MGICSAKKIDPRDHSNLSRGAGVVEDDLSRSGPIVVCAITKNFKLSVPHNQVPGHENTVLFSARCIATWEAFGHGLICVLFLCMVELSYHTFDLLQRG